MEHRKQGPLLGIRGTYEGEERNGLAHGKGTAKLANGFRYEGDFAFGRPQGRGVLHFRKGGHYEGQFYVGEFSGLGKIVLSDGN